MLSLPMPFGAFQPSKPAPGGPVTVFPWGREQELLASCDVRQLHLHSRQSLRPTAASACSTLRVMKTFAKPSLGKNNSKAGTRKEARPHSHHQSRVQRPCTDLGTEDDFRAGKDVPVTMRWEPQQDPVREGTPRMLSLPMPFGAFQPSKPAPGGPVTVFPWGR
jgi:hypothetical protein